PFDVKHDGDPFSDQDGETRSKYHTRIAEIIAEIFTRQHRILVYSVCVFHRHGYLMFWDRSGTVVTEPLVLTDIDGAAKLFRFLCIIGRMNNVQLGYDHTIQQVGNSNPDVVKMKAHRPLSEYHTIIDSPWPLYRVLVHTDGALDQRFIIGRHHSASQSVHGRGTQGFVAYDPMQDRMCFLKQAWRADRASGNPEYSTYKLLHEAEVKHVATPICGGDGAVSPTRTFAQKFFTTAQSPIGRILHRFVVEEVFRSLCDICSELCPAVTAHEDAWEKAGILYRDVSEANILIYEHTENNERKLKGVLTDWDMCKTKARLRIQTEQANRMGTWKFLSAKVLNLPEHTLRPPRPDDLESFIYVLLWMGCRYHTHDHSDEGNIFQAFLYEFF
ncbi:hypothetical protein BXZ70DRAFT_902206, partial [Cristinia sonorae]